MKVITILGAGKSSRHIISYLSRWAAQNPCKIQVIDRDLSHIPKTVLEMENVDFIINEEGTIDALSKWIETSTLTISMLPNQFHPSIAQLCLKYNSHLITPSYLSEKMEAFDKEAKEKNLLFLNEMGFDPGIDHMIAMKVVDEIKQNGGQLKSYKSYVGGLMSPKNDSNPWKYKFTWSPRNVVLAGQGGTSKFLENKIAKYVPYCSLFNRRETVKLYDDSEYDVYANRDSIQYIEKYNWHGIETLVRGTMRRIGFSESWHHLVLMGLTDDSHEMTKLKGKTYNDFYSHFYPNYPSKTAQKSLADFLQIDANSDSMERLESIGFFDNESVLELEVGTPAQVLQSILEDKWKLNEGDIDQSVMTHIFEYTENEKLKKIESTLILDGDSTSMTSMSKLVGLPLAIASTLIVENEISERGVFIPTTPSIYNPLLKKLEELGISPKESCMEI